MPGKSLAELIREGDKNAIDRIHFRKPPEEIDVIDKLDIEEKSYNPTRWYPLRRSRKIDGLNCTFTTCFKNDNPEFPVALLDYETASNSDKVTLTLVLRDKNRDAILPVFLATTLYRINNPAQYMPANIPVPNPMIFFKLDNDLSDFNFICDHMCPVYLIHGKQSNFGSLYFIHEHNQTIRLFREKDYQQPLVIAGNLMLSLYKSLQFCRENKNEQSDPIVEHISFSPHTLKY